MLKLLPLGRTGLRLSKMMLGGAAFGQQYGPVSVSEARATVFAGLDAGINFIDTSAFYGEGRSEEILGEVLADIRGKVGICTKAGRITRDRFDFSAAGMTASLEASLKRLRTDHVEILLAHDIEFADDFERIFTETAEVLHRLKAAGKCQFIGMSGLPLGLLRQAIEKCQLDVVISYCHHTLQSDRLLRELLPVAEEHGVGVLNASPLSMGLLTQSGPPIWHPAPETLKQACAEVAGYCSTQGVDLAILGMQYVLHHSTELVTITGTAKADELTQNLKATVAAPDPALLAEVQRRLAAVHNVTWPSGHWPLG
ncbi:MAG: aldo/keto reductase [Fimbriiglobus sp.]